MIYAESQRLILRRPKAGDFEPLLEAWSDPDMTRYTGRRDHVDRFVAQLICDMQAKQPGDEEPGGPWFQFVVERREDGCVLGDVGVGFWVPGERQVELGYRIRVGHQRQGYGREAVSAIIDFLIARHRIHRFVAVVAAPHHASARLLTSLGFRQEGLFRQSFFSDGEWLDDKYFALLASEWDGQAAARA